MWQFFHPYTGMRTGVTSFQRRNLRKESWDNAGHVDWSSNTTAKVCFGMDEVCCPLAVPSP